MAEPEKKSVNKKMILQDLLEIAKKNGKLTTEQVGRAVELLELDEEQQNRLYATLEKLHVKIEEETISPATDNTPTIHTKKEEKPAQKTSAKKETSKLEDKHQVLRNLLETAKKNGKISMKEISQAAAAMAWTPISRISSMPHLKNGCRDHCRRRSAS